MRLMSFMSLESFSSERSVPEHSDAIYLQSLNKVFLRSQNQSLPKSLAMASLCSDGWATSSACWFPPGPPFEHFSK